MMIAPATPTHSSSPFPAGQATAADCPPQRRAPEAEYAARETAAPEIASVAVLGYN
jgi:hypothetical protein